MRHELDMLKTKVEHAEAEAASARSAAKKAHANATKAEEERESVEDELQESEKKRKDLQSDLSESRTNLEKHMEAQLASARQERDSLTAQLEKARHMLEAESDARKKSEAMLQQAESKLDAQKNDQELQGERNYKPGPCEKWLRGLSHQQTLAMLMGLFGLASVAGPMTFVHCFKAVVGSALGGLLLASFFGFFVATHLESPPKGYGWLDALEPLMGGSAAIYEYLIWMAVLIAGVARWYCGWEWLLYAVIDDVYMTRPIADAYLKEPLLGSTGLPLPTLASMPRMPSFAGVAAKLPRLGGGTKPKPSAPEASAPSAAPTVGPNDPMGVDKAMEFVQRAGQGGDMLSPEIATRLWDELVQEAQHGFIGDEVMIALMNCGLGQEGPASNQPHSATHITQVLEAVRQAAQGVPVNGQPLRVSPSTGSLGQPLRVSPSTGSLPPAVPPHDAPRASGTCTVDDV